MLLKEKIKKAAWFFLAFLFLTVSGAYSLDIIILPPIDLPPGGGDEVLTPSVSVNPETLNLSSNIRNITVYIEFAGDYYGDEVDRATVNLYADGSGPVSALEHPWEASGNTLMLKFCAEEVKGYLFTDDSAEISLEGELLCGQVFAGGNTIRVIDPPAESPGRADETPGNIEDTPGNSGNAPGRSGDTPGNSGNAPGNSRGGGFGAASLSQARYRYSLEPIPEEASLVSAYIGSGRGYEVTAFVREKWVAGEKLIELSAASSGDANLYIEYSISGGEESLAAERQNLKPVTASQKPLSGTSLVRVYYDVRSLERTGVSERDIALYGWNETGRAWEPVEGAVLDDVEKNLSAPETGKYSLYRVMSSAPAEESRPEKASSSLGQNYPNPFNPATTIPLTLTRDGHVTLKIYNMRGQLVATLVDGFMPAGNHNIVFPDGETLSRGVYYYQLRAGSDVSTRRMAVR